MTFDGRVEAVVVVPAGQTVTAVNNGGGPTSVPITAGSYFLSALCTQLVTDLTSARPLFGGFGAWQVTLSTGPNGTGQVTIGLTVGTFSLTWPSTLLQQLLGFTAAIDTVASATGSNQARGVWIPDCPLVADGDPKRAPMASDMRQGVSPKGDVFTLVGTTMLKHTGLAWSLVALNRVWTAEELVTNQAYETFWKDTQLGAGHPWFGVGSALKIYDQRGISVGQDASVSAWNLVNPPGLETLKMSQQGYTGLWRVEWPQIVSSG